MKLVSEDSKNLTFSLALFLRVSERDRVYTMGKVCKELQHLLSNSLIQLARSVSRQLFLDVSHAPFCQRANPVTLQTRDPFAAFPGSKALFLTLELHYHVSIQLLLNSNYSA